MRRYTRQELLRASGARPDELAALEAQRLLVPHRPRRLFWSREPFYTAAQLEVCRFLLRSRRAWEATRRAHPAPQAPPDAAVERPVELAPRHGAGGTLPRCATVPGHGGLVVAPVPWPPRACDEERRSGA